LGPVIVVLPGIIAFHIFNGSLSNADQAYPLLVNKVLPNYLLGFFAAVLFGAVLSSFNSALNSSVTLFGLDIYKSHLNPAADDLKVVQTGKRFGIVLALFSMTIAPFIAYAPAGLFGYLQEVNGCYSIPILTIILVGYFTLRVPALAAKIAILSGVILYSISQFILKPFVFGEAAYPHYLHVMAILFVLNVAIMLLVGKLSPGQPRPLPDAHAVDMTPWGVVKPAALLVVGAVIGVYLIFSRQR